MGFERILRVENRRDTALRPGRIAHPQATFGDDENFAFLGSLERKGEPSDAATDHKVVRPKFRHEQRLSDSWCQKNECLSYRVKRFVLVMVAVMCSATAARADFYQCTRRDGTLHYTNTKERGSRCKRLFRSGSKTSKARRRPANAPPSKRDESDDRFERYNAYIEEAAALYQLPVAYVRAVIKVESNYMKDVVSRAGALGLMQMMPATAKGMGVTNAFDARQNILGGSRFLRILANRFGGDLVLTTAAYNAGPGAVNKYGGIPPYTETRRYVRRVLTHYRNYLQQPHGSAGGHVR